MKSLAHIWALLFWLFCVVIPIVALLSRAMHSSGWNSLWDPNILAISRATVWQASWSTAISVILGLPLGLWVGNYLSSGGRGGSWAQAMLALPFGIPTVVAGMVWVSWLGRAGILSRLGIHTELAYSLHAVILAHVFYNAPWIALLVAQARAQVPAAEIESANSLGADGFARMRFIIWPRVRWALASGAVQVLSLCAMSFALVLLLGGGPPVETLETALFGKIRYGGLDLAGAVSCAFWELLITFLPWLALIAIQSRSRAKTFVAVPPKSAAHSAPQSKVRTTFILAVCAFTVMPYLVFLAEAHWSLFWSSDFLTQIIEPLELTLLLAVTSSLTIVITAVAGIIAVDSLSGRLKSAALALLGLPAGISVLVLGLGFWLAYGRWIDPFEGSFLAMVALQTTLFFPLAFRSLWPVSQGIQKRLLDAAATLGASPLRAFMTVEWPRWRAPLLSSLTIVAGASIGEVAAVSLFYSERLIPLPLIVTRWMNQYRFEEAQLVAVILLILSAGMIASMNIWKNLEN